MREYYYTLSGVILVFGFYLESDCHLTVGILIVRFMQALLIRIIAIQDVDGIVEGVILIMAMSFLSAFVIGHGQYEWYTFIIEVGFCFSFFIASVKKNPN